MKKIRLAIIGFGKVANALLRHMQEPGPKRQLADARIEIVITGIADIRGNALDERGIPVQKLLQVGTTGNIGTLNSGAETKDALEFVNSAPADVLLVTTPAGVASIAEIKAAFARRMHVVTSNKTPVATAYQELVRGCKTCNVQFRFGATVLAGYPPWRQFFESISPQPIQEIQIVVNATSNQILTMMLEEGKSFAEGVKRAQELGIAERDPRDDTEGHDTQKKLVILTNTVMAAALTPEDVPTTGISNVTVEDLRAADRRGQWIQLLGRAWKDETGRVRGEVKPVITDNPFFVTMRGTAMGLYFITPAANFGIRLDLGAGERALMATAAGMFEDILTIAKGL